MQAVRLRSTTRAATSRALLRGVSRLVGDVQPGRNPVPARDTYTLKEWIQATLRCCGLAATLLRGWSIPCRRCTRIRPPRRFCAVDRHSSAHFDRVAYAECCRSCAPFYGATHRPDFR